MIDGIFAIRCKSPLENLVQIARPTQLGPSVNEELIETLHDYEPEQSAHFDQMEREWEEQLGEHGQHAQTLTTGQVPGQITDPSGAVVPDSKIAHATIRENA